MQHTTIGEDRGPFSIHQLCHNLAVEKPLEEENAKTELHE
jgi:hypothetical protein